MGPEARFRKENGRFQSPSSSTGAHPCNENDRRHRSSQRCEGFLTNAYLSDLCKTFKRLKTRLQCPWGILFSFLRERNVNLVCVLTWRRGKIGCGETDIEWGAAGVVRMCGRRERWKRGIKLWPLEANGGGGKSRGRVLILGDVWRK